MTNFSPNIVEIEWNPKPGILEEGQETWDKVNIYRSPVENENYEIIDTINSVDSNDNTKWITSYVDESDDATKSKFYLVRYYDSDNDIESDWIMTLFTLSPREQRLINEIKKGLDRFSLKELTDEDLRSGLLLGLQYFNMQQPITRYTINNFPKEYEMFLVLGGQYTTILRKYLDVAVRDFTSSDSGISLNINRGEKMQKAIDRAMEAYNDVIASAKVDLAAFRGSGLGTMQLPLGGYNLGRNVMNLLNVFQGVS